MLKKISVLIILVLICVISVILYFNLREFELKTFSVYNEVCNEDMNISSLNMYVYNLPENKITQITDFSDIYTILTVLNDSKIKRKNINSDIMGEAACRLVIENTSNNKNINVVVFKNSINIADKRYTITENSIVDLNEIFEIIRKIVLKYDEHALYC